MPEIQRNTAFCLGLGCAKNRVDSERFAGALESAGFTLVSEPVGAEICVVNTCGFLRSAVEENIEAILDLAELKEKGDTAHICIVGCLVNRYGKQLAEEIPEVDFWGRCEDYDGLVRFATRESSRTSSTLPTRSPIGSAGHVRYLKLSEGCDNRCAYCAIPLIRGNLRSLPLNALVEEAQTLVESGAKEICLVGQDLTAYGMDLKTGESLIPLLDALESSLPHDIWLRLLYLQPQRVDRALLERVANGRQILPYLDIPMQHASEHLLVAMNREADATKLLNIFRTAREIRPDFALRTTCMVGFPGETKADFNILLRFLAEAQFDRVGAFAFSPEEGTPAVELPGQLSKRTKLNRLGRLMAHQEEISFSRQELFIGRELPIMIDAVYEDGTAEGRSFREAPEVDGSIEIRAATRVLTIGEVIPVRITDAFEHDMIAIEAVK